MKLADQVVLNLYFAGQQHLVSGEYNYLLAHQAPISEREGLGLAGARVLHFNGRHKPWLAHEVLRTALRSPAFIKACGHWYEGYVECLQQLYLQKQVQQIT
jgi:lipopolysaccharide biosynthesis glycosyltransferase